MYLVAVKEYLAAEIHLCRSGQQEDSDYSAASTVNYSERRGAEQVVVRNDHCPGRSTAEHSSGAVAQEYGEEGSSISEADQR